MANQVTTLKMEQKFKKTPAGEIPVDWDMPRLSDVTTIIMGQSPSSSVCNQRGEGIPFYQGNADFGAIYPTPNNWCSTPKKMATTGDILISVRAPVGAINVASHECCIGRGLSAIRATRIDSKFLYYALGMLAPILNKLAQGSTFEAINSKELANLPIPLPPNKEQKKIAEILSTVDDAIEKISAVIEKSNQLKKGLMQTLLTHGIGHKKFKKTPAGEIPVEWEVIRLGELAEEIYRYPTYFNIKYVPKGVPEIRGELIRANGKLETDKSLYRFISQETAEKFPQTRLIPGDFVLSVRGTIGKVGIVPESLAGANMTANLIRISPNRSLAHPDWLLFVLLSDSFKEILNATSSSTTIKTITSSDLKDIPIACPAIQEQKEIAEILSGLDAKIEQEEAALMETQKLKHGLMRELLSGKVRTTQ